MAKHRSKDTDANPEATNPETDVATDEVTVTLEAGQVEIVEPTPEYVAENVPVHRNTVSGSNFVRPGKLYSDPRRNYRKDMQVDQKSAIVLGMTTQGWVHSFAIQVEPIDETGISNCLLEREALLAELEVKASDAGNADAQLELQARRFAWFELDADGNPTKEMVIPDYYVVTGNRRVSSAIHYANMARLRGGKPGEPLPKEFIDSVPIVIHEFSSEAERIAAQIQENQQQRVGWKSPNTLESFLAAAKLFQYGYNEKWFRDQFNTGLGQKWFAIFQLDKAFPSLEIIKRIQQTDHPLVHLPLEKLDRVTMMDLRTSVLNPEKGEFFTATNEQKLELVNNKLLALVVLGTGAQVKNITANRKAIEGLKEQTHNPYIASAADWALGGGNAKALEAATNDAPAVKLVYAICRAGHVDKLVELLSNFAKEHNVTL